MAITQAKLVRAARKAQRATRDLWQNSFIHQVTLGAYDPVIGTTPETITAHSISGFFSSFNNEEILRSAVVGGPKEKIEPTDERMTYISRDAGYNPTTQDRVKRLDGTLWNIFWVKQDASKTMTILHIRKK